MGEYLIGGDGMGFAGLLGNEELKRRLTAALASGKTAHSYLIVGPEGSGRRTLARLISAALECTADGDTPCLTCRQCKKVLAGTHPDVVRMGKRDKKRISVDEARWVKNDLYIRPNEGKKKIYVFPPTHLLGREAQNALLKVMEEPPEYGVFLILTAQAEQLLPTIRSRCAELTLLPVPEAEALPWLRQRAPKADAASLENAYQRVGGYLGAAEQLLRGETDEAARALASAYAEHDRYAWTEQLFRIEKGKREQLTATLEALRKMLADGLAAKNGRRAVSSGEKLSETRTAAELLNACRIVEQALGAADANVGVGHICGWLATQM